MPKDAKNVKFEKPVRSASTSRLREKTTKPRRAPKKVPEVVAKERRGYLNWMKSQFHLNAKGEKAHKSIVKALTKRGLMLEGPNKFNPYNPNIPINSDGTPYQFHAQGPSPLGDTAGTSATGATTPMKGENKKESAITFSGGSGALAKRFEMTLLNPGTVDAPFVDEGHICPAPHGIIAGHTSPVVNNNATDWVVIFLCPSLAAYVSTSITDLKQGYNVISKPVTYAIQIDDMTGGGGSWIDTFGNTTAASKIFPWSGRMEVNVQIPDAVQMGTVYYGNANAQGVIGMSVGQLVKSSTQVDSMCAGKIFEIQNCVVERGIAHHPWTTGGTTTTSLPQDERVSWMIFSSGSQGTIGSTAAPSTYVISCSLWYNYFWVPLYQPQVVATTEATIKEDMKVIISPSDKAEIEQANQLGSVIAHMGKVGLAMLTKVLSPAAMRRARAHMITSGPSAPMAGAGRFARGSVPSLPSYKSNVADLDYLLQNLIPRWGDFAQYPTVITEALSSLEDQIYALRELFIDASAISKQWKDDLDAGDTWITNERGLLNWKYKTSSGKTFEDYEFQLRNLGLKSTQLKIPLSRDELSDFRRPASLGR